MTDGSHATYWARSGPDRPCRGHSSEPPETVNRHAGWQTKHELPVKEKASRMPDALIAATALVHKLTPLTSGNAEFRKVPGLRVRQL